MAHWNLSLALLLSGDFAGGWEEYEWRWKMKNNDGRNYSCPLWQGEDIVGRTINLHVEQGFGDTIQFIRYAPMVMQRGAKVIVECQPQLVRLLASVEGLAHITDRTASSIYFDMHAPLLSLPRIFSTTLKTIPCHVPYLSADRVLVAKWRQKIEPLPGRFRVGLVWAGNPTHGNDRNRSCALVDFALLAKIPNVIFYSLRKDEGAEQCENPPHEINLVDLTRDIADFADTAALMDNLDLIISVDTAVAHLAGALGRPVWTLLPFVPDWRWLLDRRDNPWYPTMRLFRQSKPGNWRGVMADVANALREYVVNSEQPQHQRT